MRINSIALVPVNISALQRQTVVTDSVIGIPVYYSCVVVKCSDVVTLAVSDAWSVVEFETRELPPDFCNPESQRNAGDMTWHLYVKLVTEHLHYSQRDVTESEEILRIITEQKVMGAPEIDIIQVRVFHDRLNRCNLSRAGVSILLNHDYCLFVRAKVI